TNMTQASQYHLIRITGAGADNGVYLILSVSDAHTIHVDFGSNHSVVDMSGASWQEAIGGEKADVPRPHGKGGQGANWLRGDSQNNTLIGGPGDDNIIGADGDDFLYGMDGIDQLWGGKGDDHLFGGNGDDFLFGGDGDDLFEGDAGADEFQC